MRIERYGPSSLLGGWEWFSGLSALHKPVDMVYLPFASHLLVKPWERFVSEQGNVDWFSYWLKDEKDPDPSKAKQYARWDAMRRLMEEEEKGTTGPRSN